MKLYESKYEEGALLCVRAVVENQYVYYIYIYLMCLYDSLIH